jgi:hypothetical protein
MLGAAAVIALSPLGAIAGQDPQRPAHPPAGQGTVVVERVENGPAVGLEFKYTEMNRQEVFLLGGYAGVVFDGKLLIGGAGYWQVDSYYHGYDGYNDYNDYNHYNDYYGVNGYGGLLLEWYALRSPVVSVSARGLVGGGVATVGYAYVNQPAPRHGPAYPPVGGYYAYDQTYFIFEPQVNVTLRIAPGVAMVGGVGYRVIGWANGWEDQIQGLTGSFAIRFGGGR